eukprot:10183209-Alexandrium_andersonii.AAC.1
MSGRPSGNRRKMQQCTVGYARPLKPTNTMNSCAMLLSVSVDASRSTCGSMLLINGRGGYESFAFLVCPLRSCPMDWGVLSPGVRVFKHSLAIRH